LALSNFALVVVGGGGLERTHRRETYSIVVYKYFIYNIERIIDSEIHRMLDAEQTYFLSEIIFAIKQEQKPIITFRKPQL
jgi:hypothetical protein